MLRYCGEGELAPSAGMVSSLFTSLLCVFLQDFFRELSKSQERLGITGLQLSLTTLEEVFLHIARVAELETAVVEKKYKSILLPSGVIVQVSPPSSSFSHSMAHAPFLCLLFPCAGIPAPQSEAHPCIAPSSVSPSVVFPRCRWEQTRCTLTARP